MAQLVVFVDTLPNLSPTNATNAHPVSDHPDFHCPTAYTAYQAVRLGADSAFFCPSQREIPDTLLNSCTMLHYDSLIFAETSGKTIKLLQKAQDDGKVLSYHPQWIESFWKDKEQGIAALRSGLSFCHICKVSEEEMELLTGETDLTLGLVALHLSGPSVVILTRKQEETILSCRYGNFTVPSYGSNERDIPEGDSIFMGAFLACLLTNGCHPSHMCFHELQDFSSYAGAAKAMYTASPANPLPEDSEIQTYMKNHSL